MRTIDLSLLEVPAPSDDVLAGFARALRRGQPVDLVGHGLDLEILELLAEHGPGLLTQIEFHRVLRDQRRMLRGIAQRVLRIAGGRSEGVPDPGSSRTSFRVRRPGQALRKVRGSIAIEQVGSGRVQVRLGRRLARRRVAPVSEAAASPYWGLTLELGLPPRSAGHMPITNGQFRPARVGDSLSA